MVAATARAQRPATNTRPHAPVYAHSRRQLNHLSSRGTSTSSSMSAALVSTACRSFVSSNWRLVPLDPRPTGTGVDLDASPLSMLCLDPNPGDSGSDRDPALAPNTDAPSRRLPGLLTATTAPPSMADGPAARREGRGSWWAVDVACVSRGRCGTPCAVCACVRVPRSHSQMRAAGSRCHRRGTDVAWRAGRRWQPRHGLTNRAATFPVTFPPLPTMTQPLGHAHSDGGACVTDQLTSRAIVN